MTSINHCNNLCLVTLHFPSSTPCHCPDHVPPRELGKKFDKILNPKNTLNNNPNNILNNLCTGLETFLGFNSASKGYDGKGIVYSDLDRLCDAVMGFLSGVLEAVKDDDAVKTYDKHLQKPLETVLKEVNKNIGSGRYGLVDAVDAVKGWLEGYGKKLDEKTKNVENDFSWLLQNLNGNYKNRIKENDSLQNQLTEWTNVVQEIADEVTKIEINRVSELDKTLKDKVMYEMKVVKKSVEFLMESAGKGEFDTQILIVDEQMSAQRDAVICDIKEESEEVQRILEVQEGDIILDIERQTKKLCSVMNSTFTNIFDTVGGLSDATNVQFDKIRNAVRKTIRGVDVLLGDQGKSFEEIYKTGISQTFDNIDSLLNELKDKSAKPVKDSNKSKLRELAESAESDVSALNSQLDIGAGLIGAAISDAVSAANMALKALDTKVRDDLDKLKERITGSLDSYIKKQLQAIVTASGSASGSLSNKPGFNILKSSLETGALSALISEIPESNNVLGNGNMALALETALNALKEYGKVASSGFNPEDNKVYTALKTDLDKIVGDVIQKLTPKTSDFQEVFSNLHKEMTGTALDGNENSLHVKIGDITSTLTKYFMGTIDKSARFQLRGVHFGSYEEKRSKVESDIRQIIVTIKALEKLPHTVGNHKFNAERLMEALKRKVRILQIDIDGVEESVNAAMDELRDAINVIKETFSVTRQKCMELVSVLQQYLSQSVKHSFREASKNINKLQKKMAQVVEDAFRNVTDEIRTLFSDAHKANLAALKTLVDGQKAEIERIIDHDKANGVKGLMERIYGGILYEGPSPSTNNTLVDMMGIVNSIAVGTSPNCKHVTQLSYSTKHYLHSIFKYITYQVKTPDTSSTGKSNHNSINVDKLHLDSTYLLEYLIAIQTTDNKRIHTFDYEFCVKLYKLKSTIDNFIFDITSPCSPLLAPLKAGLINFTAQLGHAYVNRYSGQKYTALTEQKQVPDLGKPGISKKITVDVLTPEGRNCAKVCLTIVEILGHDLGELRRICSSLKNFKRIYASTNEKQNPLGDFFNTCGFDVASERSKQDGELRNSSGISNHEIRVMLSSPCNLFTGVNSEDDSGKLKDLVDQLHRYYEVGHLGTFSAKRHPCSVYEMLIWLSGLPNNVVYDDLTFDYFAKLFDKPKEQALVGDKQKVLAVEDGADGVEVETGPPIDVMNNLFLAASPHDITVGELTSALTAVCAHAHSILTAIQGHGHANGVYAVDFNTNEYKLSYPRDAATCFDMLVDMLHRLHAQLYFLYLQCYRTSKNNSWRDCWYGQGIGGSSWECNTKQCPNQTDNQKHNQSCDQKCNQTAGCGIKSPLQSFLEDGLPGFLPHRFDKVGCKMECTVPNHRGIPCITPMGFTDISVAASHTQKGDYLMLALEELCGKPDSPLNKLCGDFTCLLQKTPKTLDDMFAFFFCFINGWKKNAPSHKSNAFIDAVSKANFGDSSKTLEIAPMFGVASHANGNISTHTKGDLYCLYSCDYDGRSEITCGRYLKPIGLDTWIVFSKKNASRYLSWVVYLTETFYTYLENLYNECCEKCNKKGTRCYEKCCDVKCKVNATYDADKSNTDKAATTSPTNISHTGDCKSIAQCPFTRPILYKYGFVFNSLSNLSGTDDTSTKRTCRDFCNTLKRVLNKTEADEAPLAKLIYVIIPKFLFEIRKPFMLLTLALWLLSLLYLLHILIIRLDLLHIKSHLHSPSSHRIAAQSLLAAGRVNKLNRVFYLQP